MYTPCSRIALTVAMETMHFFIVQLSLSLRTKILCISGVPMNDLAPMKNCPGGGGCKVGQISSQGNNRLTKTFIFEQREHERGRRGDCNSSSCTFVQAS